MVLPKAPKYHGVLMELLEELVKLIRMIFATEVTQWTTKNTADFWRRDKHDVA